MIHETKDINNKNVLRYCLCRLTLLIDVLHISLQYRVMSYILRDILIFGLGVPVYYT